MIVLTTLMTLIQIFPCHQRFPSAGIFYTCLPPNETSTTVALNFHSMPLFMVSLGLLRGWSVKFVNFLVVKFACGPSWLPCIGWHIGMIYIHEFPGIIPVYLSKCQPFFQEWTCPTRWFSTIPPSQPLQTSLPARWARAHLQGNPIFAGPNISGSVPVFFAGSLFANALW